MKKNVKIFGNENTSKFQLKIAVRVSIKLFILKGNLENKTIMIVKMFSFSIKIQIFTFD